MASSTCCTDRSLRLHGIGPEQLRIGNLITRVEAGNVDEVILATNPTVEGEATATYLSQQLKRLG